MIKKKNNQGHSKVHHAKKNLPFFRVFNNTGETTRSIIFFKNIAVNEIGASRYWVDTVLNDGETSQKYHFTSPVLMEVTPPANNTLLQVSNGYIYGIDNETSQIATLSHPGGSSINFNNNTSSTKQVSLLRDGGYVLSASVDPSDTHEFQLRPTVFILVTEDLDGEQDLTTANTEISFLGVYSAQLLITKVADVFSIQLTNIVFA